LSELDKKEINEIIKGYELKLDALNMLEEKIDANASGYELAVFTKKVKEKMEKLLRRLRDADSKYGYDVDFTGFYPIAEFSRKIGSSNILNEENQRNYETILEVLRKKQKECKSEIGYYEFLKVSPKPKDFEEEILYEHNLEDFIKFLDNQYQIWEKSKHNKQK